MNNLRLSILALALCGSLCSASEPAPANRIEEMGTPPQAPRVVKNAGLEPASLVTTFSNVVNISSRETSRQFFNLVYGASENVPINWSGSISTCTPGTNSSTYLQAVARRVNYFRA